MIYNDNQFGFMLDISRAWTKTQLLPQFERDGGRIALRSQHGATLNVSCGDPDPSMPNDRQQRTGRIVQFLKAGFPQAQMNPAAFRPASDDVNVASGQIIMSQGVHGLISIIRDGVEYAIQYSIPISAPYSTVHEVNNLVLSFRFSDMPTQELFLNPESGNQPRSEKKWWQFWR